LVVRFAKEKFQTKSLKGSFNPVWNATFWCEIPEGGADNEFIDVECRNKGHPKYLGSLAIPFAKYKNMAIDEIEVENEDPWMKLQDKKSEMEKMTTGKIKKGRNIAGEVNIKIGTLLGGYAKMKRNTNKAKKRAEEAEKKLEKVIGERNQIRTQLKETKDELSGTVQQLQNAQSSIYELTKGLEVKNQQVTKLEGELKDLTTALNQGMQGGKNQHSKKKKSMSLIVTSDIEMQLPKDNGGEEVALLPQKEKSKCCSRCTIL